MHTARVSAMAHSRSASSLLRRGLLANFVSKGGRSLVSLSVSSAENTSGSGIGSEGSGWRASAGVVGGVTALTGFMSLLQLHHEPVTSRSEGVQ